MNELQKEMLTVQIDSRENKNAEIIAYFQSIGQAFIVSKMYAGDYCNAHHPTVLIEVKKDVEEVVQNLTKEHERFKREILRANEEMKCKLVVLIRVPLPNLEAVKSYKVRTYSRFHKNKELRGKPMTAMSMETLYKIMSTMQQKYNLEWRFCTRENAGAEILKILKEGE